MLEILCSGFVGGLAGTLGFLVSKALVDPQKSPQRHRIILVVCVVAGSQIGNALVAPEVRAWRAQRDLSKFLKDDSLYSALLNEHPELRPRLETTILEGLKNGSPADAREAARVVLAPVLPQYLFRASDDALLGFTEAMLDTLRAVQLDDPVRCYQYLHPGIAGTTTITESEGRSQVMQWMVRVVESAQQHPHPSESGEEVLTILEGVQTRLIKEHGDLSALANPADADKAQVCEMTIALNEEILKLPPDDGAALLRYLYEP